MFERAQVRALPLLNKSVDLAPATQACCGVCRTCATTNIVTMVTAAIGGAVVYLARLVRRLPLS
jgi:hypothetical protein